MMRRVGAVLTGILLVLLLIAAVLLALAPDRLETPTNFAGENELTAFFERLVATQNPPSLAVSVVKEDEVVYQRAFGSADGPAGIVATPESIYRWWSLTKILTAVAILQLHERGQLDIEDEVRTHLPFFETTLRGAPPPPIRLRHLLNHSSGLANLRLDAIRGVGVRHRDGEGADAFDEKNFPRFSRLRATPGRRGRYSNFGYVLLGDVIERVSGQRYEDYIAENILVPLGMEHTGFVVTDEMRPFIAAGCHPIVDFRTVFLPALGDVDDYVREIDDGRLWLTPFYLDANAYGGALGSVVDATRLLQALLNGGKLEGATILESETTRLMLREHRVRAGPSTVAPAYSRRAGMEHGLGFWIFPVSDGLRYEHTGAGLGFASLFRMYPAEKLAITVLANGTSLDREGIAESLYELFRAR